MTQVYKNHHIVFSPFLTVLKEELDTDLNKLVTSGGYIYIASNPEYRTEK